VTGLLFSSRASLPRASARAPAPPPRRDDHCFLVAEFLDGLLRLFLVNLVLNELAVVTRQRASRGGGRRARVRAARRLSQQFRELGVRVIAADGETELTVAMMTLRACLSVRCSARSRSLKRQ
jgi:hypothetical protein